MAYAQGRTYEYIVVCVPGFGPDHLIGPQARAARKISDQVRIVSTHHSTDWVYAAVKKAVPNLQGIYVARLDPDKSFIDEISGGKSGDALVKAALRRASREIQGD